MRYLRKGTTESTSPRCIRREARTVSAMVRIYCRGHHEGQQEGLCEDCRALLDYANARLSGCHFQMEKPTCAKCPIHCYRPDRREQIRSVMRYAGPRMLLHHPVLALQHLRDSVRS